MGAGAGDIHGRASADYHTRRDQVRRRQFYYAHGVQQHAVGVAVYRNRWIPASGEAESVSQASGFRLQDRNA